MLFWFVGVTAFVPPPRQHANPILEIQRKHVKSFRPQQQRLLFGKTSCRPRVTLQKMKQ